MVVMLLDDNPDIILLMRMMVTRILSHEDCQFLEGRNGQEGIDMLTTNDQVPELIISNFRMPQMDGLTFFQQVRQNAKWADIRLVMMSAHPSGDLVQRVAELGAESFLRKPFNMADVEKAIRGGSHN